MCVVQERGSRPPREAERSDRNVNWGTVDKLGHMMAQDKAVGICAWCKKGEADHPEKRKQENGWDVIIVCVGFGACVSGPIQWISSAPFAWTPSPGWTLW